MDGVISVFLVRCRSRRDKFNSAVATETCRIRRKKVRCREPSRTSQTELERLFRKAEKFPKSSRIHSYVLGFELNKIKTFNSRKKVKKMSSIKDFITFVNERGKCYELLLSGDVETNPGPTVVNPSKTIFAP